MADFSFSQLEGLWIQAGGPKALAPIMAAIALAESGGNPNAYNPSGASGLWQILGAVSPADQGSLFNPQVNAHEAVLKYKTQGLGAWVTYTSGAYRQFLPSGYVAPATVSPQQAQLTSLTSFNPLDPFSLIDNLFKQIGGLITGGGSIASSVQGIGAVAVELGRSLDKIFTSFLWLLNPAHWVRIIAFVFGIGALLPGIWMLSKAGQGEGDISLALGILLVMVAGILLWVAFHNLGDNVKSLRDLLNEIQKELRANTPA